MTYTESVIFAAELTTSADIGIVASKLLATGASVSQPDPVKRILHAYCVNKTIATHTEKFLLRRMAGDNASIKSYGYAIS